jgi:phenylacetic acid degradation operon negative regulatory protein
MGVDKQEKWDGKWRMVIFDIPEESRDKRDLLRLLLKRQGFIKLQASVFVNPYSLNSEALNYLKKSGLMKFIRIARVEKFDDDNEIRKKFGLNK